MKLLVIEDQETTAQYLAKGLKENGFVVDTVSDGEQGLIAVKMGNYDLIILDGLLPKIDGWTLVKKIRDLGEPIPILFLSARDSLEDRVRGLENGADSYLIKPFAFTELLAQVKSLLRRKRTAFQMDRLTVSDLIVDLHQQRATRGGKKLDLTPKELLLLILLVRRKGDVLSRTLIAEQIWGMNFDSDTNVVDVHIRRLRLKVDEPFSTKLIQTVRGFGYSINDPIEINSIDSKI